MAKTTIIQLTDDLDGSPAVETIAFGYDGQDYEIDLSKRNAAAFRKAMSRYAAVAEPVGRRTRARRSSGTSGSRRGATLYSGLDDDAKKRFRKWAKMPHARRISDERVKQWVKAGRP